MAHWALGAAVGSHRFHLLRRDALSFANSCRAGTLGRHRHDLTRDARQQWVSTHWLSRLVAVGAGAAVLLVMARSLPASIDDTRLGVERWAQQAPFREAENLVKANRPGEAITKYKQANLDIVDTRYGLAAASLQTGDTQGALGELTNTEPPDRFEPYLIRGEAARQSGNLAAAKTFFTQRVVNLAADDALSWAWDHLNPPLIDNLTIGDGLDIGYIRGFYSAENDSASGQTFRWTTDELQIRNLTSDAPGESLPSGVAGGHQVPRKRTCK